ncbi:hypothetical protein Dimus_007773 [Dionaea muscipula]
MTKGRRLQLPSAAFVCGGRGRRGNGGRGRLDFPDRARANTRDFDDRDQRNSRDAEDRPSKPPSTELTREKEVATEYPRVSQKRLQLIGPIDFQDPIGGRASTVPLGGSACGSSSFVTPASYAKERLKYELIEGRRVVLDSSGHFLPRELRFAGPQPKIYGLPHPYEGFICCESLNIAGQLISVSQEAIVNRDAAWKKVKNLEEEIAGLRELHKELTNNYNAPCEELEQKIERLEKRITELEQQRPSSMDEMFDLWQASEEGKAAIIELSRPSTKAGYNMAYQHFASYLSEVPADKKWDGLPWPHDDIGVTDQNIPFVFLMLP